MRLSRQRESVDFLKHDRPSDPLVPSRPKEELIAAGLIVVGTALVTWAYHIAPTEKIGSYDPIFWAGMVLVYLTVTWRAICGRYTVVWLGFLGLFTVLPKFLMSPHNPIYYDETAHFALLQSTISGGKPFQYAPLLPIGTYYPGLESTTAAIHWMTGLSAWGSALVLLAVAHCLLIVQIYYIARALGVPHLWAAVASLLYATNPSFIYEDVQFSYESLAVVLMLTIVRLYLESLAAERVGGRTWRQSLLTGVLLTVLAFGCVVTHHLTTLTGILLLLLAALFVKPHSGFLDCKAGWRRLFVRYTPVLMLAGIFALWVGFEAPGTIPYLLPHVSQPFSQLVALASGSSTRSGLRAIFSTSTAPRYERAAAVAAPALTSLALLFAVIGWLSKRRLRRQANFFWSFALAAIYLVSLPITLIAEGAAGAHRTWASTYVGVALLPVALAFLYELNKRRRWLRLTAVTAGIGALIVLLIGNVAAGTPTDYRFPGPYKFGSDTLSVTSETLSLVHWVQGHLGPNPHVVTDRYTSLPLVQRVNAFTPVQSGQTPIAEFWYNRQPPEPTLMHTLQQQGDDYLIVDLRDTEYSAATIGAPLLLTGEPNLVPKQNMTRLAQWPWLKLMYSSTDYRVYRINFVMYYLWYPYNVKLHVKA